MRRRQAKPLLYALLLSFLIHLVVLLGPTLDFGFSDNYTEYRTRNVIGTLTNPPLIAFQPLGNPQTGSKSEGPSGLAFSPTNFPSPVANGVFIGFHGRQEFGQSFRAVELRTGKVRWSQDRFGAGSVTLVGNRLLIVRESGELVLATAAPEGFKPIARAQILPATVRAYPAISDGMVYLRNDDTLVCLDLRK